MNVSLAGNFADIQGVAKPQTLPSVLPLAGRSAFSVLIQHGPGRGEVRCPHAAAMLARSWGTRCPSTAESFVSKLYLWCDKHLGPFLTEAVHGSAWLAVALLTYPTWWPGCCQPCWRAETSLASLQHLSQNQTVKDVFFNEHFFPWPFLPVAVSRNTVLLEDVFWPSFLRKQCV